MTTQNLKKFAVLYHIPLAVMENWMQTPEEVRKPAEEKMRTDWGVWMGEHAAMVVDTQAAGKTKRVTRDGSMDARNDIILYSIVEAQSHEAAAEAFETHPHLQIPEAFIEIMEIRPM